MHAKSPLWRSEKDISARFRQKRTADSESAHQTTSGSRHQTNQFTAIFPLCNKQKANTKAAQLPRPPSKPAVKASRSTTQWPSKNKSRRKPHTLLNAGRRHAAIRVAFESRMALRMRRKRHFRRAIRECTFEKSTATVYFFTGDANRIQWDASIASHQQIFLEQFVRAKSAVAEAIHCRESRGKNARRCESLHVCAQHHLAFSESDHRHQTPEKHKPKQTQAHNNSANTKFTQIHFVNGKGPTDLNLNPIPATLSCLAASVKSKKICQGSFH
uniref:Uncharacterized protein n=1 Tax=Strigamia maritima TaxID=126957 RepID=T1J9M7_STRMM